METEGSAMWMGNDRALRRRLPLGRRCLAVAIAAMLVSLTPIPCWSRTRQRPIFDDVAFSPDGKLLAVIGGSWIYLWDETGRPARTLRLSRQAFGTCLTFSRDGRTLVSGSNVNSLIPVDAITVWDVATGRKVRGFMRRGWVNSIALSPDGNLLAAGASFGVVPFGKATLRVWDLRTGRAVPFPAHRGLKVGGLSFSPGGSKLAICDDNGVSVVDTSSRREERVIQQHRTYIGLAFSPDAKFLTTSHADGTIRLWDARTWKVQVTLTGHEGHAGRVAFSPDGRTLASSGADDTIRLWDVASGRQLRCLARHQRWARVLAYLPDGKTLASATLDATLKEWDAETGEQIWDSESRQQATPSGAHAPQN